MAACITHQQTRDLLGHSQSRLSGPADALLLPPDLIKSAWVFHSFALQPSAALEEAGLGMLCKVPMA